ncbi:UDP-glucose/GDP-mannose dehydrogenase family protein [Halorubraceae archaeon YAN]|nr:UDP-glucose/GDP-mannose dehydrogenase family protein [Halorubraceae archaeon YAN]
MRVSIVGSGYVGTTIATAFAELGHEVLAVDIDQSVVDTINRGESPIHEPGVPELLAKHSGDRIQATTEYDQILNTDVTFLALLTPSDENGHINTSYIEAATESLGDTLASKETAHTVIVKSTVIPGTTEDVIAPLLESASGKTVGKEIHLGMNPEFLREGFALEDFRNPDKIVLGAETPRTHDQMEAVFTPLIEQVDTHVIRTGIREAEIIKYANNAFLATKISLINELGNICKEYDVDTYEVADAIGKDDRIGERFLASGVGWGGSCFPKDVAALIAAAREKGYDPTLLSAAVEVNAKQPARMLELLASHTDLSGKRIAVLGLSFKPGTDDIRGSRAVPIIDELLTRGATVVGYDPVATANMREQYPDLSYADSAKSALSGADGAVVVTDWDEFSAIDAETFGTMAQPIVIDGRRIIDRKQIESVTNGRHEGLTW